MILQRILNRIQREFKFDWKFLRNVDTVIHVGANIGQERHIYAKAHVAVYWIEPIPEVFETLSQNLSGLPMQKAYKRLLTDQAKKNVSFNVASNDGASSSILDMAAHLEMWPDIKFDRKIMLVSSTLDQFIAEEKIELQGHSALVMDTQGAELLILKGGEESLKKFSYVKLEAADFEAYVGCCKLSELTSFLSDRGFALVRKDKFMTKSTVGNYFDVLFQRPL